MYIQITTLCNMSCPHCIFSCEAGNPVEHMSREVFEKALDFAESYGEFVTLGGGEPTLHPDFHEYLIKAIAQGEEQSVFVATNGTVSKTAKLLHKLTKAGVISCELSMDEFHEMEKVKPEVIQLFTADRMIRDVSGSVVNKGAAAQSGVGNREGCACSALQVRPNGDIYLCGCPNALKLGSLDVLDDQETVGRAFEVLSETDFCGDREVLSDLQVAYIEGRVASLDEDEVA